jgi:hypothetical protein
MRITCAVSERKPKKSLSPKQFFSLGKLLVGELKTNAKHGASVEGLVMMYDLFVRLLV